MVKRFRIDSLLLSRDNWIFFFEILVIYLLRTYIRVQMQTIQELILNRTNVEREMMIHQRVQLR